MPEKEIILPKYVSENWSNALMLQLGQTLATDDTVVLNAGRVCWLSPFGTVLLSNFELRRLMSNKIVKIKMPDHAETSDYIVNSGLLQITRSTNMRDAIDARTVQLRLLYKMEPMVPESLSEFVTQQARNVEDDEKIPFTHVDYRTTNKCQ